MHLHREADEEESPMRPVPPRTAVRIGAAVPSAPALASLQGCRAALPSTGLGPVPTSAARTCRRSQHVWGRAQGAMTAALVIVPVDPARARSASAHRGRVPGSRVRPREVPSGAPWMVRLSMGSGDIRSAARLAPARKHLLGSHSAFLAFASGSARSWGWVGHVTTTSRARVASYW